MHVCSHGTPQDTPLHLHHSGCVNSMDRNSNSFWVMTFQWIEGAAIGDKLIINVTIKLSKWYLFPYYCVPNAKGMVNFTSIIWHVQVKSLSVDIKTISFLNNNMWPSMKTLNKYANLPTLASHHQPLTTVQWNAKRHAMSAFFNKEKRDLEYDWLLWQGYTVSNLTNKYLYYTINFELVPFSKNSN